MQWSRGSSRHYRREEKLPLNTIITNKTQINVKNAMRQTIIIIWQSKNIKKACHIIKLPIINLRLADWVLCECVCVCVCCAEDATAAPAPPPISVFLVCENIPPPRRHWVCERGKECVFVCMCVLILGQICTTKWMAMLHLGRGKLPINRFSSFIIFIVPVLCVSKCQHNLQSNPCYFCLSSKYAQIRFFVLKVIIIKLNR